VDLAADGSLSLLSGIYFDIGEHSACKSREKTHQSEGEDCRSFTNRCAGRDIRDKPDRP
jgi:hypothetical protein